VNSTGLMQNQNIMTKNKNIPQNYQTIMPYLIIDNAIAFIEFSEQVFNAKLIHKVMRDEKTVMHGEIMIDECTIMFADATTMYTQRPAGMFVYVNNADEVFKRAIDAGATIVTLVSDQPYGRSGGVLDPFGNTWWITTAKE
jgi:PhnB protein